MACSTTAPSRLTRAGRLEEALAAAERLMDFSTGTERPADFDRVIVLALVAFVSLYLGLVDFTLSQIVERLLAPRLS